jgi:hypothetical protein
MSCLGQVARQILQKKGFEEINSDLPEADFNPATVQLPKLETWTALQNAYIESFSYDLRFEYQTSKVIPSVLHGCTQ